MFNQSNTLNTTVSSTANPMRDFEVVSPPEDSTSSLAFSPATIPQNFLVAGSWDCNVRCWEVEQTGKTVPKSMQSMTGPILDVCWHDVSFLKDIPKVSFLIKIFPGRYKSIYGILRQNGQMLGFSIQSKYSSSSS